MIGRPLAGDLRRLALRQVFPLAVALVFVTLLWQRANGLDLAHVRAGVRDVHPGTWALALALSALSFLAVGRYDAVLHRILNTGTDRRAATLAGATAISVAQSVGFGVISGALVRWRMLPDLSLGAALRLSVAVALSFLAGWAVVTALMVLAVPAAMPFPASPALAAGVLALAALAVVLTVLRPGPLAGLSLPPLRALAAIVGLTVLDTFAAGAALWVLLPDTVEVALPLFLTAFLVALGAGLILGTPGGVGPFEMMLLGLLPQVQPELILSGVLGFRGVYYAVPALIGAAAVIIGPRGRARDTADSTARPPALAPARPDPTLERLIARAPDATAALLRQGRWSLLQDRAGRPRAMVAASGQSLVMLGAPLGAPARGGETLALLEHAASAAYLAPCLYKAPGRLAVQARRRGWQVMAIAREAWLDPADHSTEGRGYRQLRRKLARARKAGLTVDEATAPLPIGEMARINAAWAAARGGERGFSMGVFNPATLAHDRVFLVRQGGRLVGFLTLHEAGDAQMLDLMRHDGNCPDGAMHLALDHAIRAAARRGIRRLSLAAVPVDSCPDDPPWAARLRARFARSAGAAGLGQFKAAFCPRWQPLYLAAPDRAALALAAVDIAREITRPPQPPRLGARALARSAAHHLHAAFGFAISRLFWQSPEQPRGKPRKATPDDQRPAD